MIRTTLGFACIAFFSLAPVGAALAATLTPLSGKVLVSTGKGFNPVAGTAGVSPGDRVMVQPGGSAELSFGDGCSLPLSPGAVFTVPATSPCAIDNVTEGAPSLEGAPPVIVTLGTIGAAAWVTHRIYTRDNRDTPASP